MPGGWMESIPTSKFQAFHKNTQAHAHTHVRIYQWYVHIVDRWYKLQHTCPHKLNIYTYIKIWWMEESPNTFSPNFINIHRFATCIHTCINANAHICIYTYTHTHTQHWGALQWQITFRLSNDLKQYVLINSTLWICAQCIWAPVGFLWCYLFNTTFPGVTIPSPKRSSKCFKMLFCIYYPHLHL